MVSVEGDIFQTIANNHGWTPLLLLITVDRLPDALYPMAGKRHLLDQADRAPQPDWRKAP